jgi:hypothetical protein
MCGCGCELALAIAAEAAIANDSARTRESVAGQPPAAELTTIGSLIARWLERAPRNSPTHDLSVRIGQ